ALSIGGIVKDGNGEPLPGTTVFLSGTKLISSTDRNGRYLFKNLLPGSYLIVAKFIGFDRANYSVNVVDEAIVQNFILKEMAQQLQQVVITGDAHWEEHYQEFKKRFLGSTPNAGSCRIINKEVLHFRMEKGKNIITATADDFLEIINDALGYKIKYLLDEFKFDSNTGILSYQGYPSFEELKARDSKQEIVWRKNRYNAYTGSIYNFIQSLYDHNSDRQGFRIYSSDYDINSPLDDEGYEKRITIDAKPVILDSIVRDGDDNFKVLTFKKSLFIVFVNDRETFNYKNSGYMLRRPYGSSIDSGEYSMISLLDNDVLIDSRGNYNPPGALVLKGHMAWEHIADLTPLDSKISKP
ncbi:carboxypeptidase-like regulatory domain-containing protein, partial [Mucilaginibacter polytrichastri]